MLLQPVCQIFVILRNVLPVVGQRGCWLGNVHNGCCSCGHEGAGDPKTRLLAREYS